MASARSRAALLLQTRRHCYTAEVQSTEEEANSSRRCGVGARRLPREEEEEASPRTLGTAGTPLSEPGNPRWPHFPEWIRCVYGFK